MNESLKLLVDAIDEHVQATITVRDTDATSVVYVRLIETSASEHGFFWAEVLEGDKRLMRRLAKSGALVEMSFNWAYSSVFFDTKVLENRKRFFKPRRLLMSNPEKLTVIERRKDGRERVPDNLNVVACITRAQESERQAQVVTRVWDLSPTGASLICPPSEELLAIKPGERLSIALQFEKMQRTLEVHHRYTQPLSSSSVRLGVQFVEHDATNPAVMELYQRLLDDLKKYRIRGGLHQILRSPYVHRKIA
jgi:hypothetical protein